MCYAQEDLSTVEGETELGMTHGTWKKSYGHCGLHYFTSACTFMQTSQFAKQRKVGHIHPGEYRSSAIRRSEMRVELLGEPDHRRH